MRKISLKSLLFSLVFLVAGILSAGFAVEAIYKLPANEFNVTQEFAKSATGETASDFRAIWEFEYQHKQNRRVNAFSDLLLKLAAIWFVAVPILYLLKPARSNKKAK